jgi:hypothetical protein
VTREPLKTANRSAGRSLPIAIYPVATPIAAILYLGASVGSHPMWVIRPLVVAAVFGLLMTAVLTAIVRDKHRAGIAAWAMIVGLTVDDPRASVLLWGTCAVLLTTGFVARRKPWRRGPRVTSALTVFAVVLLVSSILRGVQVGGLQAAVSEIAFDLGNSPPAAASAPLSDIYVLLLDAYPGPSAARAATNFDASALVNALAVRAFDVAADPRANYMTTRLTLASMFAARHLPDIERLSQPGTREADSRELRLITDDGVVLTALGSRGYERIALVSGFSELGPIRVDRLVIPPQLNEMEAAIFQSTGAGHVIDAISPDYLANEVRSRVLDSYEAAGALAQEPHTRPRFAFIHVPAPHAPWVTDADGHLVVHPSTTLDSAAPPTHDITERERHFYDYATWVARQTIATVDRIIEASPSPPIIIVFSDHGPDVDFDNDDPLSSDLEMRTSCFVAVLTPGHRALVPDGVTLVNLFPYLLNSYLGSDLPIQPDTFWAWKANSSVLDFVEVDPLTWKPK